ncbi:hypothetical protein MPTK1_7g10810 [Marchantia polymorpha subsp. ruderalis]|uniref:SET domain-containing protein n=2 Tax=Marchantia polymorpha TaxID=3197 RepID=A0AAF6BY81_MARPO|nr:hypothetical protein MARPO_0003s0096 [Marchantia polymorpha]BBN16965.1 hypothetical protein Mp_7g10810 [Marchantia polymorpha subsp. ruderalis]|eukprot:PTQ49203.1 hypothetical protein MARPO_0003s0096 [Marchantia polymorpha]
MTSVATAAASVVAVPFGAARGLECPRAGSSRLSPFHGRALSCSVGYGRIATGFSLFESQSMRGNCSSSVVKAAAQWNATGTLTSRQKSKENDELEVMEPEFYRMGYIRHFRAYGVEFKEGPMGVGVYAAKDIPTLNKARVIMEIPAELMITISQKLPWLFYPDFLPIGHPLFEIINATDPETDWDFRLACLLLLALDQDENFWQLYSDYLPGNEDSTSLLLATEEELQELHNEELAETIRVQKKRVIDAWTSNWPSDSVLKLKRLARDADQFLWAVGVAWSRKFNMSVTIGAKTQEVNMLIPYADMLNHSFQPTCSMRWRRRDRMLEVVMNAGQTIKQGDEMTLNYFDCKPNDTYMQLYGFSSAQNPWDVVKFSGNAKIHLDSFLSAFNLAGMLDELYYNVEAADVPDTFVDGAVIAAARTLPTWSDGDLPFLPSHEIKAARALQVECQQHLDQFPTTLEDDRRLYESQSEKRSPRWQAAVRYRMDRKVFLRKIIKTLDLYMQRILY